MDNRELSLEDFLALNMKESIERSCMFFKVEYRKSWSKKRMADALAEGIRKDPLKLFFALPEEGLRFLASLFRKDGIMELDPLKPSYKPKDSGDFVDAMDMLTLFGLVQVSETTGSSLRLRIVAPYELKKVMTPFLKKEMRQFSESIDMMADVARGLLYYFGVVELETLVGMMKDKVPSFPGDLVRAVVRVRAPLGNRVRFQEIAGREYAIGFDAMDMAPHEEREFVEDLVREIEARVELEYKSFSLSELLEASEEGFVENAEEYELLLEELWDYFILDGTYMDEEGDDLTFLNDALSDEEDFEFFLYSLIDDLRRTEDLRRTLEILEANMDFPTRGVRDEVLAQFTAYTDTISRVISKGHTPLEMESMGKGGKGRVLPFKKNNKVGRNDPCPCGSGKKYKNCHGSVQNPLN